MSRTFGSLFSGFDGAGIGAKAAGFDLAVGLEINDRIAQVARDNGHPVLTADVLAFDPAGFPRVDWLHASPECQRASTATSAIESALDIELGKATARFITAIQPKVFTLENVFFYRTFKAFKIIQNALHDNGYLYDFDNLNSADYGVPQTRKRLWLRAVRGGLFPNLPQSLEWRGWYTAIEDLIPDLPDSYFAKWQIDRLPKFLKDSCLFTQQEPRDHHGRRYEKILNRKAASPAFTVTAQDGTRPFKAFIADAQNGHGAEKDRVTVRLDDEPVPTVSASGRSDTLRAFIVSGAQNDYGEHSSVSIRRDDEPVMVVTSSQPRHPMMAGLLNAGRIVKMNARANARFQAFPDDYILPATRLAFHGIGNAVPPPLTEILGSYLRDVIV